jgi:hypothetical protein
LLDEAGIAHPSLATLAKEALKALFKKGKLVSDPCVSIPPMVPAAHRRNSQDTFSSQSQTVIIFDWDDTLFPTTYVKCDLGLSVRLPLQRQNLFPDQMKDIQVNLAKSAAVARQVLQNAAQLGKVVIVTLARKPWVMDSCDFFYPGIRDLITENGIKVIYAQEGEHVEYNKVNMMADADFEAFWAGMKGRAIGKALDSFYSQYEGQSWKNVISIGDSDFERLGTMSAVIEYAKDQGLMSAEEVVPKKDPTGGDNLKRLTIASRASVKSIQSKLSRQSTFQATVNGHDYKVRTKTFKMLDEPALEELSVELTLIQQWLPLMVNLNEGFDVDLNSLDDNVRIKQIEDTLNGCPPAPSTS